MPASSLLFTDDAACRFKGRFYLNCQKLAILNKIFKIRHVKINSIYSVFMGKQTTVPSCLNLQNQVPIA